MDEEPEPPSRCSICLSGCKTLTTFLLSHVGLVSLVVGYCVIGAFTFEALEWKHEIQVKRNMTKVREAVSHDLWLMTRTADIIVPDRWAENASKRLQEFESELMKAMKKGGWDGTEREDTRNWTFTGALFYSIIVITTIGYGHIAPKTLWGKVVTIFYAIIGIPLMVVCWSHIGDFMANAFRFIYWKVCCYICTRKPKPRRGMRRGRTVRESRPPSRSMKMKRSIRRSARVSQRSADSAMSDSVMSTVSDPGLLYVDSLVRQSLVPSTTLPRGSYGKSSHQSHQTTPARHRTSKSAEREMMNPAIPVLFNKYAEEGMIKDEEVVITRPPGVSRLYSAPPHPSHPSHQSHSVHSAHSAHPTHSPHERFIPRQEELELWDEEDEDYDESDYEEEDVGNRPVPIWLCSFLVLSYIIGGAYLFSSWEKWNFLDSAYFCFITLTTIGFGDFVPAQGDSEVSIALCSLYLLFGIALLAMSFNLVQEQVINSVKQLAMRLGIIDEEET